MSGFDQQIPVIPVFIARSLLDRPSEGVNLKSAYGNSATPSFSTRQCPEILQEHELVVESDEYSDEITVEGIIENTTDEMKDYVEVSVRVYDADGNQLDNYWTNTTDLQAGGTWKFEIMIYEEADDLEEYDIRVTDSAL